MIHDQNVIDVGWNLYQTCQDKGNKNVSTKIGWTHTDTIVTYRFDINNQFWKNIWSFPQLLKYLSSVRNHVKLEIRSFVLNFNSWGFSLRVLYCVVDTGYALGRSPGDCKPALPEGPKYQMVKTQTESHNRRPIVWPNWWQIWVSFSFEVCQGTAGICHAGLWGFTEAL